MFPYTENYTESESDTQNNNLFYKLCPKCQSLFDRLEMFVNIRLFWMCSRNFKTKIVFCIMYKFYNSYFVIFATL